MTSGTRTVDARTQWNTACGSGKAGLYSTKTWNGADQPPAAVTRIVQYYRDYDLVPFVSRDGRRRMRRVLRPPREVVKLRRSKRATVRDEHPYSATIVKRNDGYIEWSYNSALKSGTFAQCFGSAAFLAGKWSSNDDIILLNKLRARLVEGFDAGVFIAELPQACRMISSAAIRIARALSRARRGEWWGAEEALVGGIVVPRQLNYRKRAAQNWLELQYGWRPLLNDVYEGARTLAHLLDDPLQQTVRAKRSFRTPNLVRTTSPNSCFFGTSHLIEGKTIKAVIRELNIAKLTGLTNPETILWEKLPWSFVADWFIPIGNYLEARGVCSAVQGSFITSSYQHWYAKKVIGVPPYFIKGDGIFYESIVTSRAVSTTLSVPLPTFKPLKKALGWEHCANAVALVTSSFK